MQWAEINWPRSGAGHGSQLPLSLSPNLYLFEIGIGNVAAPAIPLIIRVEMKRCYRLLCGRCQEASSLGIDLGVEYAPTTKDCFDLKHDLSAEEHKY